MAKKIYKVKAYVKMEIVKLFEAKNEKEAESLANDSLANGDINVCIHGSETTDGLSVDSEDFCLTDGDCSIYEAPFEIDEYEEG